VESSRRRQRPVVPPGRSAPSLGVRHPRPTGQRRWGRTRWRRRGRRKRAKRIDRSRVRCGTMHNQFVVAVRRASSTTPARGLRPSPHPIAGSSTPVRVWSTVGCARQAGRRPSERDSPRVFGSSSRAAHGATPCRQRNKPCCTARSQRENGARRRSAPPTSPRTTPGSRRPRPIGVSGEPIVSRCRSAAPTSSNSSARQATGTSNGCWPGQRPCNAATVSSIPVVRAPNRPIAPTKRRSLDLRPNGLPSRLTAAPRCQVRSTPRMGLFPRSSPVFGPMSRKQ
jgi:hypothetical protein